MKGSTDSPIIRRLQSDGSKQIPSDLSVNRLYHARLSMVKDIKIAIIYIN